MPFISMFIIRDNDILKHEILSYVNSTKAKTIDFVTTYFAQIQWYFHWQDRLSCQADRYFHLASLTK